MPTAASPPSKALRVSVIIPAYAAEATIEQSLDSVLAQSYPVWEIIVVDDGSPSELAVRLIQYGARIRCIRQTNGGAARARNRGIEMATGDLVAFLDADDTWSTDKLAHAVAVFREHPEVQFVASRYKVQDCESNTVKIYGPRLQRCGIPLQADGRTALNLARNVSTPTVVLRRELLQQNRFDPSLTTAEDRDLWIRLLLAGKCFFLAKPLVSVLLRDESLSHRDINVDCRCMLRVIRRYASEIGRFPSCREQSYVHYKWATGRGVGREAWFHLLQSLHYWPLPFSRERTSCRMARLRFAVGLCYREFLARHLRSKKPT